MKYIIDLDALKDCLDLLRNPVVYAAGPCVYLSEVKEMIDRFPKEEYGNEYTCKECRPHYTGYQWECCD